MSNFSRLLLNVLFLSILISDPSHSQSNKVSSVSGKVKNEEGAPIEGFNIYVANQKIGTKTNNSGFYELELIDSNNEMSNIFHVRGGSGNDNLLLLEGISLSQPREIRNSYQESISLIHPAFLQSFQLMAGYFPARYGEKLHSLLSAEYRRSTDKPIRGEAEMSLFGAGIMLEGKMLGSGYWGVAGRWVDKSLVLGSLQTKGDYNPKYYDIQLVSRIPLSSKHKLNLFGIILKNNFDFTPKDLKGQYDVGSGSYNEFHTKFDGLRQSLFQSSAFSAMLESRISTAVKMKNYVIMSYIKENDKEDLISQTYHRFNVLYETNEAENGEFLSKQFEFRNNIFSEKSITYKSELTITVPEHVLQLGGYVNRRSFNDHLEEALNISYESHTDTIESSQSNSSFIDSARLLNNSYVMYGEDTWRPSARFSVNYGIRAHYFTYNTEWSIGPRLCLKYTNSPKTWLAVAWGQFSQPPQYREFRDSNHNLLTNVKSQRANQTVISFYHRNRNQTEIRAEAYYIDLTRLIPFDYEDIFLKYQPEYHGTGRTYGLSLYLYRKFNKRLNTWLGYNYMVSRQRIKELGDEIFPGPTDQRHTLSIVLQDDMPNLPNMRVHTRVLFGSGYPFTAYRAEKNIETGLYFPVESKRLGLRMPYYRRIDAGFSYDAKVFERYDLRIALEIFNIFDFRNLLSYKFFILQDGHVQMIRNNFARRLYNLRINFSF